MARRQETPVEAFNRLLGNKIGRPTQSNNHTYIPSAEGATRRVNAVNRGDARISLPSRRVGRPNTGSRTKTYNRDTAESIWQETFQKLQDDFANRSAETETLNRINQAAAEEGEDRPWWGDIQNAVGLVNPISNEGFSSSIIGRAIDLVSRAPYGLFEGFERLAGQETHRGYSGEDMRYTLGNFFSGFGAGFTGQEKTGFGQAYEALQENPTSSAGRGLKAFEEAHPLLEQRFAQGVGALGEVFLDPTNRFIPARMNVTADGAVATSDVLRRTMDDVVRNVSADMAANTNIPAWVNNPQHLIDSVTKEVANSVDNTLLDVAGGGKKGTRLNRRGFSEQASSAAAARMREGITEPVRTLVEKFRHPFQGSVRNSFTWQKLERALQSNQDFADFYTDLVARLESRNLLQPGLTPRQVFHEVFTRPTVAASRQWDEALETILSKYDHQVNDFRDELASQFNDAVYPTLGVNVYGNHIPVKGVGRAYRNVARRLEGHGPFGRGIFDNLNISKQLPDRVALFSSRARSGRHTGIESLSDFNKKLKDFFRNYSKEEMTTLTEHLDQGIQSVGNPRMDAALTFIRDEYEKIRQTEVQWGARDALDVGDDYNFLFNKGGSKKARTEFKKGRKAAFKDSNVRGAGSYDLAGAKAAGLNPVTHAGENLFRRFEKMQRDVTKQSMLHDLVNNYGLQMKNLSPAEAKKLGLVQVPSERLDLARRTGLTGKHGAPDEVMYLPESMYSGNKGMGGANGYYENFDEMLSWSPQNSGQFTRNFSKIINMIKFLQTVPNPGFHMRNLMGDVAMGLMDDINPADYARTLKKYMAHKAGKSVQATFNIIPGHSLSWDQAVKKFRENADTGFFSVDTKKLQSRTAGNLPRDLARGTANNLRKASDIREEMGRFVHFMTAYQDEARALYKKNPGNLSIDEIARRAEDAALWRVNAYKFDYGALTPFEKQAKSVAFPFMTYTRKAMPLLLEQLYSNPQFLSMAGRFMEYNDGTGSDAFNALNIPQYIKDMGFGMVSDGEEPSYINADMLNLGSLSLLGKIGPQDIFTSEGEGPGDFFRGLLSQLNPLMAAPIELGTGRDLYFDKPLQGNWMDYAMSQIPLLNDIQSEAGINIPGVPGTVGTENPLEARLLGLNISPKKISVAQQEQQHEANLDEAIESPLKQFNYSQDQFSIFQRVNDQGQMEYVLNNKMTGDEIATAATPAELIEYARQQPGANFQAPDFTGRRQPTYADVMARLGQS